VHIKILANEGGIHRMKQIILVGFILTFFLCACVGVGTETTQQVSVGQELIDLQKAHDKGAISDKEYVELKQKIMNRNN
jgi:hypothetical protein